MQNLYTAEEVKHVKDGLTFWLRRWYRNPLAYVIEHIGDVPTHQQAEILKAFEHHNFVAVRSGHGIGKTTLDGWLINWWLDTRGKIAPITGAGGDQLSDIVWPKVVETNRRKWEWIGRQYEITSEEIRCKDKAEVWKGVLRTARADNDDALQGFHDCMFFIDEGSGVRDGIFEVASGAMGDPGAFGFMTGNPTRLDGYFYDIFHKPSFWYCMNFSSEKSIAEKEYSYKFVDAMGDIRTITTHGRQTMKWIEDMRKTYGLNSNTYRVRVLGEFATLGQDLVVEERWLENVFDKTREWDGKKKGKRRLGIDPAWEGEDDTAFVIREGIEILYVKVIHGNDPYEVAEIAKLLFKEWDCDDICVDTIGVGAGVYSNLLHAEENGRRYPVVQVVVSESAPDDSDGKYKLLRDLLWWRARKFFRTKPVRFRGSEIDPLWVQLKNEMKSPSYKIESGKIKVESKSDMKKRGLRSPNIADALNLTFYGDYDTFREIVSNSESKDRFKSKKKKPVMSWKSR